MPLRLSSGSPSTANTTSVSERHWSHRGPQPRLNASFTDFSNILSKTAIERLADVDEYEVVREVQVSPFFVIAAFSGQSLVSGFIVAVRGNTRSLESWCRLLQASVTWVQLL